jgi:hypothetical protein
MSVISPKLAGTHLQFPAEEDLRVYLLDCAERFRKVTGMPRSATGQRPLTIRAFSARPARPRPAATSGSGLLRLS